MLLKSITAIKYDAAIFINAQFDKITRKKEDKRLSDSNAVVDNSRWGARKITNYEIRLESSNSPLAGVVSISVFFLSDPQFPCYLI